MPSIEVKGKVKIQKIFALVDRNDDLNCLESLMEIHEALHISASEKTEIDIAEKEKDRSVRLFEVAY